MKNIIHLLAIILTLSLAACNNQKTSETNYPGRQEAMERIKTENFDSVINGNKTALYTLENNNGVILRLTNFGASMVQVIAPDKNGNFEDVILGYDNIEGYVNDEMSLGCIVGRFANRIARGKFILDGKEYNLTINNGINTLHGGPGGIHSKVWEAEELDNGVRFTVVSPHMEEGYPGELIVSVTYTLNDDNEIVLDYLATTSEPTHINLTNHTYWNLNGEAETDILGHELIVNADYITPVDTTLIPTGEFMDVSETPFDFREFTEIGERINEDHPQILAGGGYDHNFVLDRETENEIEKAAALYSDDSGRMLEVLTTEPGIQVYSGNFMDGTVTGKNDKLYLYRHAIALETQHFPDSPNQPDFPDTLLEPGEEYRQVTVFRLTLAGGDEE